MKKYISAVLCMLLLVGCGDKTENKPDNAEPTAVAVTETAEETATVSAETSDTELPDTLEKIDDSFKPDGAAYKGCQYDLSNGRKLVSVIFYDDHEKVCRSYKYSADDGAVYVLDYKNTYNDDGDLTESVCTGYSFVDAVRMVYEYDGEHRKTNYKEYNDDKLVKEDIFEYNEKGDLSAAGHFNYEVSQYGTRETYQYDYDENGMPVEMYVYDVGDTFLRSMVQTFDDEGRCTYTQVIQNGSPMSEKFTDYDEKGRTVHQKVQNLLLDVTVEVEEEFFDY